MARPRDEQSVGQSPATQLGQPRLVIEHSECLPERGEREHRHREDRQMAVRILDLPLQLGEGVDVAFRGVGRELRACTPSDQPDDDSEPVGVQQSRYRRRLLDVDARIVRRRDARRQRREPENEVVVWNLVFPPASADEVVERPSATREPLTQLRSRALQGRPGRAPLRRSAGHASLKIAVACRSASSHSASHSSASSSNSQSSVSSATSPAYAPVGMPAEPVRRCPPRPISVDLMSVTTTPGPGC